MNGYGAVAGDVKSFAETSVKAAVAAGEASLGEMKINGIKLVEGNVYLYVSGAGRFALSAGDAPDAITAEAEERAADAAGEAIIVRPAKAGGEFFSVNRR